MRKKLQNLFKSEFEQEHRKERGIYSIYFIDKADFYIGSTNCKKGFESRWRQHISALRRNKHTNSILQNTYNKYGEESMKIKIVEIFEGSDEQLLEKEQFYIDSLKPKLNVNQVATGCEFPEGWISPQAKPILQYDLDGNFIKEYVSISKAEEDFSNCDIRQALKNSQCFTTQAGGFQWRYKTSDNFEKKIQKYKNPQETTILCYDSNGRFYKEFPSMLKASQELNIPVGNISKVVTKSKNNHSAYGYFFKEKASNDYPLEIHELLRVHKEQFCIDIEDLETGEKFHFDSMRQIPKDLFSRSSLHPYMKKGIREFNFRRNVTKKTFHIKITKL